MIIIKQKREVWEQLGWFPKGYLKGSGYLGKIDGMMECYLVAKKKYYTKKCVKCGATKESGKRCPHKRHQYFYWK